MSSMRQLINSLQSEVSCEIMPKSGIPMPRRGDYIPQDIVDFYSLCGGASLWKSTEYSIEILGPDQVLPANPIIVGKECLDDITSHWYTIARSCSGDYITIDFSEVRNGRCYDSCFTRHGIVGDCPIVAISFLELLANLYRNNGGHWMKKDFPAIGDAYD